MEVVHVATHSSKKLWKAWGISRLGGAEPSPKTPFAKHGDTTQLDKSFVKIKPKSPWCSSTAIDVAENLHDATFLDSKGLTKFCYTGSPDFLISLGWLSLQKGSGQVKAMDWPLVLCGEQIEHVPSDHALHWG